MAKTQEECVCERAVLHSTRSPERNDGRHLLSKNLHKKSPKTKKLWPKRNKQQIHTNAGPWPKARPIFLPCVQALFLCNKGKILGHRKSPNMKLKHSIKGLCLELWLFVCSFWYKFEPWRRGRKTIACSPGSKRHVKGSVYFHIGISTRMVPIHINLCVENCPHCINNRSFFYKFNQGRLSQEPPPSSWTDLT